MPKFALPLVNNGKLWQTIVITTMTKNSVIFYQSSQSQTATLIDDGVRPATHLLIETDGEQHRLALSDAVFLPAVGKVPAVLEFSGARVEFPHGLPDWLTPTHRRHFERVTRWEGSWRWAIAGVAVIALMFYLLISVVTPKAAHYLAFKLPENTLTRVGDEAEEQLLEMTRSSKLKPAQQAHIADLFATLGEPRAKVLVRDGGEFKANAFALPNHTVIITDQLIEKSGNDHEILAVLAHEQGHLAHRHSLQQALSGLGIGLVLTSITGDTSDLMATLPALMVGARYSQRFELEADNFAIDKLKQQQISPQALAEFFKKIAQDEEDDGVILGGLWSLVASHPDTQARIKNAEQAAAKFNAH